MKLERNKYKLSNCNPPEKKIRKNINNLDFKMNFPYYSFDKNKIDLSMLRRFLYQNNIPYYYLYDEKMVDQQRKQKQKLPKNKQKYIATENKSIDSRFEILDL